MAQLPSFLPALFEAFGNQSADVRKVLNFKSALNNVFLSTKTVFLLMVEVERTDAVKNFNNLSLVFNYLFCC